MLLSDAIDVIQAYYHDQKPLEWNDNGKWKSWYGNHGELFGSIKAGRIFRVKREARKLWAEHNGQRLTGACWPDEADAISECDEGHSLVEFVEVLK